MAVAEPRWTHFPHGADVGIRGTGPTPAVAFAQAARAMTAAVTCPADVAAREQVSVELEAASLEELFFDWIDALVFEMGTRGMLFARFDVEIEGQRLRARVWGEPVDRAKHGPRSR